jgi:hypothetical protein
MMISLKNPTVRYLIIKMAELAKAYQEPYDDHDMPAYKNNEKLFPKWDTYGEMLLDALNGKLD